MSISNIDTNKLANLFKDGLNFQKQAEYSQAERCYLEILKILPHHADTLHYLGLIKHLTGQDKEALHYVTEAAKYSPEDSEIFFNLGCIYQSLSQYESAKESYQRAINLNPKHAMAHNNLAVILKRNGDKNGFNTYTKQAYALNSGNFEIMVNYATVLSGENKYLDAIDLYKKALKHNPENTQAIINLCTNLQKTWQHSEARKYLKQARFSIGNSAGDNSSILYLQNYDPLASASNTYHLHKDWGEFTIAQVSNKQAIGRHSRNRSEKLHIGYVSSDFRNHAVANFIEQILENHDKYRFSVTAYNNNTKTDHVTERFETYFSTWRDVGLLTDEEVYAQILEDSIDILVDLTGHTANNRLMVFARKPAPIQISYLGYPNTTGLPNMDYRITDQWADPVGQTDQYHTEKLIRLNSGFLCYKPREYSPPVEELPYLKNGYITFGSFNKSPKINNEVIEVWSEILRQIPFSKLLLKNSTYADDDVCEIIFSNFEKYNISRDRITLYPFINDDYESLNLYNEMDISLDTFPYNGTTTTSESLWMGVPVITLVGESHVARVSYSILNQIGAANLACFSKEEYVNKTIELANDPVALSALRTQLRDKCSNSVFTDGKFFTRLIESVYDELWRRFKNP